MALLLRNGPGVRPPPDAAGTLLFRDRFPSVPAMRTLAIVVVLSLATGCRARTVSEAPEMEVLPAEASGEDASSGEVPSGPPEIRLSEQSCGEHADCRVFQPGDWNPRVECCYEYSCDLDYVAINQQTWQLVRDWQRANPFDCTEHLQREGPCSSRAQRCGLIQDSPAAVCDGGLCRVETATPWPAVDPEMQRCTAALDCLAVDTNGGSFRARCCGSNCFADWAAVNRQTAGELDRWRHYHATPCETLLEEATCPRLEECHQMRPDATCEGGQCVLVR